MNSLNMEHRITNLPGDIGRSSGDLFREGLPTSEADFHADGALGDSARLEIRLTRQGRHLPFCVGPLQQHVFEREFSHPRACSADVESIHVSDNLFPGSVFAEIDDECLASRLQHAVHFVQGLQGCGKILECCTANDQIKHAILKGNVRRAAVNEAGHHAFPLGVLGSHADNDWAPPRQGWKKVVLRLPEE
jgi:hypothetical protein